VFNVQHVIFLIRGPCTEYYSPHKLKAGAFVLQYRWDTRSRREVRHLSMRDKTIVFLLKPSTLRAAFLEQRLQKGPQYHQKRIQTVRTIDVLD